jgi:two-component system sensor histidine kinase GlrK
MRVSIFSRLMMGYLLLLILSMSATIYAIVQLGGIRGVIQSIILVDTSLVDIHKNLTDTLLSETRNEKKFVIMQDDALYAGFIAADGDFEALLRKAVALTDSPEVRAVLDRIADLHSSYRALFEEEAGLLRAGKPYPAQWYAEAKEGFISEMLDALVQVRTLSQLNIVAKITRLNEAGASAAHAALIITAVSLLLGITISVLITRSITVPLTRMKRKTAEISSGVYAADLDLTSPPEIGALAQAFNFMSTKLKEVDSMKSDFYALMSHELRTPLTSIKEGTNLFLEGHGGPVTEKQRRLLTIIAEESNRLIDLVNSLLDLSKLEAGMVAYHFVRTELSPLVSRVLIEVMPLAEAKRIRVTKDVGEVPLLKLDPERILQVLRNLLGNALKFTPPGGSVCVAVRTGEGRVAVSVTDTGPGIPQEHQAAIFDKFRQAALAGAQKIAGTGLGLAIVKHIVHDHGGTVWVESGPGQGSTFTIALPA